MMVPPPVVLAFGTPSARVSPSLAPLNVKFADMQVDGFRAGNVGFKVFERCSTIGVPLPIVTGPLEFADPVDRAGIDWFAVKLLAPSVANAVAGRPPSWSAFTALPPFVSPAA